MSALRLAVANTPVADVAFKTVKKAKRRWPARRLRVAEHDQRRAYEAISALGPGFHPLRDILKACKGVVRDSPSTTIALDVVFRLWDRALLEVAVGTRSQMLVRIMRHWETERDTVHNQRTSLNWCLDRARRVADPGYSWTLDDLAEGACYSGGYLRPMVEALVRDGRLVCSEITAKDWEITTSAHQDAELRRKKLKDEQRNREPRYMLNWERFAGKAKAA